jgi:hypothetical protein
MADELNKSYRTYESRGKIYDIPNDRVEYFLSKRKDAKLVNPDPADIEGEITPAKDAAPSKNTAPANDIRIPLLPGQTELLRTKKEEDININITKPSPVGLGQNDKKDAPMFSLDGRKGIVTGEAPKIGIGGRRSFQDSWTNPDYSKMAPQTMVSQQARKLGDELARLDGEINEVAGEAHRNMQKNVENMSWLERIGHYGSSYQSPMNRDESTYLQQIGVSPEKQAEIRKIRDAQKLYNDAMTVFLNPSKEEQGFMDMPEAAAKRYISNADNMRTVGVSDIFKTADVLNISEKLEAANAFDNPEKVLTNGEKALWDAFALKLAAETVSHDDTSWWTKAGELTADQATFIMQLMLGSGLTKKAADAVTKSVKKFLVASIGNKMARKVAANVADVGINAVRAAAWQPLNPAVYSRMNERMTGVDAGEDLDISPNGVHITGVSNREGVLDAYGGAVADMGLEVFTEIGGVGAGAFRALAHIPGVQPLLRTVGKTKVGQLYNTLGNSVGGKLANGFAYHGLGKETFEEFEMAVYDRLRSNPNAFEEFFDPNNLVPMLISFGAMSLGTTSVSMADWGISKAGYSAAEKRLNGRLSRYGLNEEEKNEIKESILATDVDDLKKTVGVIVGTFATDEKGNAAGDIAADVLSWLNNRIRYESYNDGLAKRHGALKYDYLFNKYTEPELDELGTVLDGIIRDVDSNVNTSTGTLMTVTLGTGANVKQVQVTQGNIVWNEDGTINKELSDREFYYKDENGEVQVVPVDMAGPVVENVSRDDAVN